MEKILTTGDEPLKYFKNKKPIELEHLVGRTVFFEKHSEVENGKEHSLLLAIDTSDGTIYLLKYTETFLMQPCKHCGSPVDESMCSTLNPWWFAVTCKNCNVVGQFQKTFNAAIKAWNKANGGKL